MVLAGVALVHEERSDPMELQCVKMDKGIEMSLKMPGTNGTWQWGMDVEIAQTNEECRDTVWEMLVKGSDTVAQQSMAAGGGSPRNRWEEAQGETQ